MPTHWESSKRPLFVRTVLVNGSRHAILTQEDPLGQNISAVTKTSRPGSARSSQSNSSSSSGHSDEGLLPKKDHPIEKGGKKCQKDLQACLVKLRLVLTTQENKKVIKNGRQATDNKKRKKMAKNNNNKKTCDRHEPTQEQNAPEGKEDTSHLQPIFKYDTNHNVTVASFFTSEQRISPCIHQSLDVDVDRISGHSEYPQQDFDPPSGVSSTLGMSADYDVSWNSISAENYFTRPFYNRLSERVLQWLDMANKKKPKLQEHFSGGKTDMSPRPKQVEEKSETKESRRPLTQRGSSEDNSEEVRTEEDVDTALSREFPKFSQELNRLHYLKAAIPVKQDAYTTQLQESIAQSFTTVVSIRSGKYAEKPTATRTTIKPQKKGHLTRQVRLEESSEEDDEKETNFALRNGFFHRNSLFKKNLDSKSLLSKQDSLDIPPYSTFSPQVHNRIPWLRDCKWPSEKEASKPQLHIFIPAIPTENEQLSDSASVCSDS